MSEDRKTIIFSERVIGVFETSSSSGSNGDTEELLSQVTFVLPVFLVCPTGRKTSKGQGSENLRE